MNRYIIYAVALLVLAAIARLAPACDGLAFSAGACYSQAVVAPYVAPVVAPLQSYAAPAQAIVLPPQVTVTRPAVTLQLQQVQGYSYGGVQALALHGAQRVVVQKQVVSPGVNVNVRRGLFGRLNVRVR